MPPPAITIIIPCYNEEQAIPTTLEELSRVLEHHEYQIVVVDDGSTDGTHRQLTAEADRPNLAVVRHSENRGYGAAIKSGLRRADHDMVLIIDADGTYPADAIPELLDAAATADMVVGARVMEGAALGLGRRVAKSVLRRLASWVAGQPIPDMNSGLRVFPRAAAQRFARILPDGFSFTTTITIAMVRSGAIVAYVPVSYSPRLGESKIRPVRDLVRFTIAILRAGTYLAPLRIFLPVVVGLGVAFVASLLYDVLVLQNLTDKTVLLLLFCLNTGLFAFLADMIDKRSGAT